MEIRIKKEYEALLPPLPPDEYVALKESIEKNGLYFPITVNREGGILDGHHRFRICKEIGTKLKWKVKKFSDPLLEKRFVIETNLRRRHLTTFQRIEMAMPLLEIEKKLAKRRFKEHLPKKREKGFKPVSAPIGADTRGKASKTVAKKVGVSARTFERSLAIIRKAPKKTKEKLRKGKLSINYAYGMIKKKEKKDFTPQSFNIWNFADCDPRFGKDIEGFRGRIPGQIVQNFLYYFGVGNGTVLDPMAGTGTTLDVVNWWNKTYDTKLVCLAYDKNPLRPKIVRNDLMRGLPKDIKGCNIIFLDPPYYDMVFNQFKSYDEFYSFMRKLANECYATLSTSGVVGLVISDLTRDNPFEPLTHNCAGIFVERGFEIVAIIDAPLTTQSANGMEVATARELKKLLGRRRVLYVFRKG